MGYGIKLTWPDSPDGRRKLPILPAQTTHAHRHIPGFYYGQQFLNVTFNDIDQSRRDPESLAVYGNPNSRPKPGLTLFPELRGQESDLLLYCELHLLLPPPSSSSELALTSSKMKRGLLV